MRPRVGPDPGGPEGVPEGPPRTPPDPVSPGGAKKCTFSRVFNNSPSRDRSRVSVLTFGDTGGPPGFWRFLANLRARGKKCARGRPRDPPGDPRCDLRNRRNADRIVPSRRYSCISACVAVATRSDTALHRDAEALHPDELVVIACMLVVDIEPLRQQRAYGVASQRSARSMQCDASHAEVHDVVASRNVSSDIAIVAARRRGEMRQHLEHRGATLRRSSCRARVAGRTAGTSRRPAAAGGTPAEVRHRPGEDLSF